MPYPSPDLYPSLGLYPEGTAMADDVFTPRLTFDPFSEDPANAPLDILLTPEQPIMVEAMSLPVPALETVTAGSINTEGALIAARAHQNRQISLTLGIIEPAGAAATNLIPDPSFQAGYVGWDDYYTIAGAARSSVDGLFYIGTPPPVGEKILRVNCTGVAGEGAGFEMTPAAGFDAGVTYYFTFWNITDGPVLQAIFGDGVADDEMQATGAGPTWSRFVLAWTPSADRATAYVAVRVPVATAGNFFLSGVSVSTSADYFDGDTAGCTWTGTSHASTSTRPASGGPRLRAIVADIQAKASKLAGAGLPPGTPTGTLRWINDDNAVRVLDILAAESYEHDLNFTYSISGQAATIQLGLVAKPYARGTEVSYSPHAETTLPVLIFTETDVPGDVPALGRLVVSDSQGSVQGYVVWGIQSRRYDSAATAALFYQAEALTAGSTVLAAGPAGASGSGNNTLYESALVTAWDDQFTYTGTHVGTFRLFVRAWVPQANGGDVSVRVNYRVRGGPATPGEAATVAGTLLDNWYLLDLGNITIAPAGRGDDSVLFAIQAKTTSAGDDIYFDYIMLVPTGEGSGEASFVSDVYPIPSSGDIEFSHDGVLSADSAGLLWGEPESYEGDRLLVPCAGPEDRSVRVIVKATRPSNGTDNNIDDISAQLHVTPRFLSIQ